MAHKVVRTFSGELSVGPGAGPKLLGGWRRDFYWSFAGLLKSLTMGIDLIAGGRRKGHNVRRAPVTKNVYVKLLEKLYR